MLERLAFQRDVYKVKGPSPLEMVAWSFFYGPDFAGLWKSAREAKRLEWLGVKTWLDPTPNTFSSCIDYSQGENGVYHQRFFIFWNEECKDYEYSLEDRDPKNQEALNDLRESAKKLSDQYLKKEDFGDEVDLLLESLPVSSSSFLENYGTKRKEWESEFFDLYPLKEEDRLKGVQSKAPKRPGETRDITIPSPGVLRRCKRINRPLRESIRRVRSCPVGLNKELCINIMEKHCKEDYHYLRDFRKIGLTLPKAVIRAFLEGFFHKYPEFKDMAIKFFTETSLQITVDGVQYWVPTRSGFHMGFFNEGLTWIQYCVHSIVMASIPIKRKHIRFTAFNDDSLISCNNYEILDLYQNIDQDLWDKLNCPLSYNKCGLSKRSFVYLEEVYKENQRFPKDSYFAVGALGGKFAINIVHAKDYVNAITNSSEEFTIGLKLAIDEVIQYWGVEFYPEEVTMPYLFGGWVTPKEEGLDASILYYNGTKHMKDAYLAIKNGASVSKTVTKAKGWTYLAKCSELSLFGDIPPTIDKLFGLSLHFLDETSAKRSFSRLSLDTRALTRFYYRCFAKRRNLFNKGYKTDILSDWFLNHPNSVISHHTAGETVTNGIMMLDEARSLSHGKPERLALQVLINQGTIRTPATRKIKWPMPLQEILMKGYLHSVPKVRVPDNGYVHETLLLGLGKAYDVYYRKTGRIPIARNATVLSERLLESAKTGVPWQIIDMLYAIGRPEDINNYKAKVDDPMPSIDQTPASSLLGNEDEGTLEHQADTTSVELYAHMISAVFPLWGGTLPAPPAVEERIAQLQQESGCPYSVSDIARNIHNVLPVQPSVGPEDPVPGSPGGGIWSSDEEYGADMFALFDEG